MAEILEQAVPPPEMVSPLRKPARREAWTAPRVREAALGLLMAAPPVVVLILLIIVPAIDAARFSLGIVPQGNITFSTGAHLIQSDTPTLAVYQNLLGSQFFRDDLALTAVVVVAAVLIVLVVSYVLALYVRFGTGRLPAIVRTLYLVPMFVPVVIASYALIIFYGSHGALNALLARVHLGYTSPIYHQSGIVLGQVWTNIPFAVLILGAGLDGVSEELVEAARDVGASFPLVLRRIVLPLNVVPTLIVLTFSFIGVLGSFTIPYLLGPNAPQMFGVAMQAYFSSYRQPQPAVAMAVLTFIAASGAGALYVWATVRSRRSA
ncbi:MAG: ABC transporter permease [Thermomicrobiales bacterium]